jgi:hypothetical protein
MCPVVSAADRWTWIDSDDKMGWFFDKESIKKTNDYRYPKSYSVWIKRQYTEAYAKEVVEEYFAEKSAKYRGLSYSLALWQIDAESSNHRVVQIIHYRDDGGVIESSSFNNAEWKNAVPDSWGEAVIEVTSKYFKT